MSLTSRVNQSRIKLSTSEEKAADFILKNIEAVPPMSIGTLAKAAQVSVPTITRLSKKLGFNGFMDFRLAIASEANVLRATQGDAITVTLKNDDNGYFARTVRAIAETTSGLQEKALYSIAEHAKSTRRIFITSSEKGENKALALVAKLSAIGKDATLFAPETMPAICDNTAKDDMLFVISAMPSKVLNETISLMKDKLYTVVICNHNDAFLQGEADEYIHTESINGTSDEYSFNSDIVMDVIFNEILERLK